MNVSCFWRLICSISLQDQSWWTGFSVSFFQTIYNFFAKHQILIWFKECIPDSIWFKKCLNSKQHADSLMIIASGYVEVNDPICSVASYYALRVTQRTSGQQSDNLHFHIQVQKFINAGALARIFLIPRVRAEAWRDNEAPYFQAWVRHFQECIWSMSNPNISFFWITFYALFFAVLLIWQSIIDSIPSH